MVPEVRSVTVEDLLAFGNGLNGPDNQSGAVEAIDHRWVARVVHHAGTVTKESVFYALQKGHFAII